MKKCFADILLQEENAMKRKISAKIPSWSGVDGIEIPTGLCLEQCSSEQCAGYKAMLISGSGRCGRTADLTGGLGIDSLAFARCCGHVLHNEADTVLSKAAESNAARLGVSNIRFTNHFISADNSGTWLPELKEFAPHWIFMDPARRDVSGKKVFLLEDCSPDVLTLLPALKDICGNIMIKLSPMADLSMLASRLGKDLKEIHVVCLNGEVKELLCILEAGHAGEPSVTVSEISPGKEDSFRFIPSDEHVAEASPAADIGPGDILVEPSAGLLKAGCFKLLSSRLGMKKLAQFTHLYLSGTVPESSLFKPFKIICTLPLDSRGMKTAGREFPEAEVTARNIPMTSEQLKARIGSRPGGDVHIWGCTVGQGRRIIAVCSRISR